MPRHAGFFVVMGIAAILAAEGVLWAGSSNSLLDVSPDSKRLLAANTDNGTVSVVDLATRKTVHEVRVGDQPEGVSWIGSGPLAVAAVYRSNQVAFLDTV